MTTFIFEADFLTVAPGIAEHNRSMDDEREAQNMRNELQSKYKRHKFYVMQAKKKKLNRIIVMPDYQKKFKGYCASCEYSRHPLLSADGSVLIFQAQGYKPNGSADGSYFYQYSADGNHRSITRVPHMEIWM